MVRDCMAMDFAGKLGQVNAGSLIGAEGEKSSSADATGESSNEDCPGI